MKFSAWVKKHLGKKTDWDGSYGVQCVDLIDCYISEVLELKIGYYGNAKTWWTNRNNSQWLKDHFYFITPNYKANELKTGDIAVRTSGTWGHIMVVAEPNKANTFQYYDQNATGNGDPMTLRTKPYNSSYINGILRPKDRKNLDEVKPKVYGNAQMISAQKTYADSDLTEKVGAVGKGERVCYLGTGEGRPMIAYQTSKGYKVGFVRKDSVKRD